MNAPTRSQQKMIDEVERPVCVVAIPGSGKTATVVKKINRLLSGHETGEWTYKKDVLALSYTKEAAKELEHRVRNLIDSKDANRMQTGTFHSYFMKALRRVGAALVSRNLASEATVEQLMGVIVRRVYADATQEERKTIAERLIKLRDQGEEIDATTEEGARSEEAIVKFELLMEDDGHFDFTSIIKTAALFLRTQGKAVLRTAKYEQEAIANGYDWDHELAQLVKADHIIVDEAQDLDRHQMDIILMLANNNKIVDIVGDDDQSIYGFRGGLGYKGMSEFIAKTDAREIKFEQNFRSRPEILQLGQHVIEKNEHRIPKTLHADRDSKFERFTIDEWESAAAEVEYIVKNIAQRYKENSTSGGDKKLEIGILARKKKFVDQFELALKIKDIPHYRAPKDDIWTQLPLTIFIAFIKDPKSTTKESGLRLCLEWAKVDSDLINLSKLTYEKADDERLRTIVDQLAIVRVQCNIAHTSKNDKNISIFIGVFYSWFSMVIKLNGEAGKLSKLEQEYQEKLIRIGARILGGGLALQVNDIGSESLQAVDEDDSRFTGLTGPLSTRISYLENSRKYSKMGQYEIKLLTMHGSKGLEFDEVWLIGCDDSTIPGERDKRDSIPEPERLEEERRILYVGITRAKNILHITHSKRDSFGEKPKESRSRTRFLNVVETHRIPHESLPRPPVVVDKFSI